MDMVAWLKTELHKRYGSLAVAFESIDDNGTQILTVKKLSRALNDFGVSRRHSEVIFKKLTQLAHCEMRGALALEDWLKAFGGDQGEENSHPENPLGASLETILQATRVAQGQPWRSQPENPAAEGSSSSFKSRFPPWVTESGAAQANGSGTSPSAF